MCLEGAAKSERGDETNFVPPYLPSVPVTNMDPDIRYSDLCISASIASINYGVALRLDLISCRNAFGGLRLPYNTTQPSSTPDTIKMPYKPPSPPFIRYAKLDPDPESSPRSKFRGCNLLYLTGPFRTIEYGGPTGSYGVLRGCSSQPTGFAPTQPGGVQSQSIHAALFQSSITLFPRFQAWH